MASSQSAAKSIAELTRTYRESLFSQIMVKTEALESHWIGYKTNQMEERTRKQHLSQFMVEIQSLNTSLLPLSFRTLNELKVISSLLFQQKKGEAVQRLLNAFTEEYLNRLGECDARLKRITDCIENKQAPLITQHITPLQAKLQESRDLLTEIQTIAKPPQSGGGSAMSCFVKKDTLEKDYKDWLKSAKVHPAPAPSSSRRQSFSVPVVPAYSDMKIQTLSSVKLMNTFRMTIGANPL